jgi:hypothetical protein
LLGGAADLSISGSSLAEPVVKVAESVLNIDVGG